MLVQQVESVEKKTNDNFVYPQYDQSCISEIPNMILNLFEARKEKTKLYPENMTGSEGINKVVLLVIDGFGFKQFINHLEENRFLTNLTNRGEVYPLTSVFPSQTTNALTTLNTGLTPQEHGLLEYFIYLKDIGVVNALQFERLGPKLRDRLINKRFDPSILLLHYKNIHNTLKQKGVNTYTHVNASNAFNVLSKLIFHGSKIIPSIKTSDTVVKLRKNIEENSDKNAYFIIHIFSEYTTIFEYKFINTITSTSAKTYFGDSLY